MGLGDGSVCVFVCVCVCVCVCMYIYTHIHRWELDFSLSDREVKQRGKVNELCGTGLESETSV